MASLVYIQQTQITKYKTLYKRELQNVEAYQASNSGLEKINRQYEMSMNSLRSSKDSLDKKLVDVVDKLKLKDKRIEYLQYQSKEIHKTDTIQLLDTILIPEAKVDTILKDEWYQLKLQLNYPSTVVVSPTFISEQYAIINGKKEYNSKPSKLFFVRWFQKKHIVVEVNLEEKSPYIINKSNKFIKIIQ
jgi:hypothetical protein